MIHFSLWDIIIILLYFVIIVIVGFRSTRKEKSEVDEYLLSGRLLTLPMFVATLVATWYGGILGIGEFSYQYGISNWLVFGMPYYIFAIIFALFIAKKVRATNLVTIPDRLFQSYDVKTSLLGALLVFILTSPAPFVLMVGILVQLMFNINLTLSIMLTTLITIVYLYAGGFRSDVNVNIVEFVLMFVGFAIIIVFAYIRFGGVEFLTHNLPPLHLTWNGGNSFQYIVVWFFIGLWTLVDPSFYQRCYAAKDGATAQKGIFISVVFWMFFDFMTCTTGLYARAALPNLSNPTFAYPLFAEIVLPTIAKGIFYVGMLATIMSSLSSFAFASAVTIGNDIVGRLLFFQKPEKRNASIKRWTQFGIIITSVLAIMIAVWIPSVVQLWYILSTIAIPGLLVPLMATYFGKLKISSRYAFFSMVFGFFTSALWLIIGKLQGYYWFSFEPMYPGLFVSLFIWFVGRVKHKRDDINI